MGSHWPDYPTIESKHLLDARLYADRNSLVSILPVAKDGKIAEIGVWRAAFSKFLAGELKPRKFFAFDIFTGHTLTEWKDTTGQQLFDGLTHRQFYEREMAPYARCLSIVEGPSEVTLRDYTDGSFDLVYLDAAHDYEAVKTDAELAVQMVAPSGVLVFDDYTLRDPNNGAPYGVVPVVNDLVANHGWRIVGYALHEQLRCNVALVRSNEDDPFVSQNERLVRERDRIAQERDVCTQERDRLRDEADRLRDESERLRDESDRLRQELVMIQHSRSWRATRPLRQLAKALRSN